MPDTSVAPLNEIIRKRYKTGVWLSWLSLLALPVGLLAIGGGPCAGPRNAFGSAILFTAGLFGSGGGLTGIVKIVRGNMSMQTRRWVAGAVSIIAASLATFIGVVYLFIGYMSLQAFTTY
jgi:hypothetical protein